MRDLKPGEGQAAVGAGLLLWGIVVGGIGVATAGIGIGIPLIPIGLYMIARGVFRRGHDPSKPEDKKNLEETGVGKFWLGILLCIIGVPAIAAGGIGIIITLVGVYLIWSSLTK